MGLSAVKILEISVTNSSKKEILEEIQKYLSLPVLKRQKPLKIFTPNTEQLVFASKNPNFKAILNQADVSLPDAIGVVWASKILTKKSIENRIPGVEFMEDLVAIATERHVPVGLIGGKGSVAVGALDCLQKRHPGLIGWADENPDAERLAKIIRNSHTNIVFVALGPPKQEKFILDLSRQLLFLTYQHPVVLMAVGGSFDIISGRLPRAPGFMRMIGLEWFWRLLLEPWRVIRQLALVEFVWLVLRKKLQPS